MSRKPWNRLLWGVKFTGSLRDDEPMLLGNLWMAGEPVIPYVGEPTRALLFCTREQARAWCARKMREWQSGDEITRRWRVRAVRVRETVMEQGATA
jgi:hypothetical protein